MTRLVAVAIAVLALLGVGLLALRPADDAAVPVRPIEGESAAAEVSEPERARVHTAAPEPAPHVAETPAAEPPPTPQQPESVVSLVVVGPEGAPFVGAHVSASAYDGRVIAETEVSGVGRAVVRYAKGPGVSHFAWARGTGPRDMVSDWIRVDGRHAIPTKIVMLPGANVGGVVVDARSGLPLAGVRVEIRFSESRHMAPSAPPLFSTTATDGSFGPVLVPRDRHVRVAAAHPGHVAAEVGRDVPVEGAMEPMRVELEPGGSITVTVATPDGAAQAGARVLIVHADRAYTDVETLLLGMADARTEALGYVEAATDAGGRAVVDRLRAGGAYVVLAAAEGWAPSEISSPIELDAARPNAAVTLTLRAFGRIAVRVVDPNDEPIETATVRLAPRFRFGGSPQADAHDGAHTFEALTPGAATVIVEAEGYPTAVAEVDVRGGETAGPTVRMLEPVSITGVVLDGQGLPVAGMGVFPVGVDGAGAEPWARPPVALTDASGAFVASGLSPGAYALIVRGGAHQLNDERGSLEVMAPSEGVTIRVVRTATVRMRLIVPDGVAPPRTVSYSGAGNSGAWNFRDGRVALSRVHDGDHVLRIHADGFVVLSLTFHVSPGEVVDLGDVLLDTGVPIRGRVVTPSGAAVAGAVVRLDRSHSLGDPKTTTDADGRFEIPHATRDGNRLSVSCDGFVSVRPTVPGDPSAGDVVVELPRGAVVRVRARRADGSAAFGAPLVIRDASGEQVATPHADQRGVAELRLAAGRYDVAGLGSEPDAVGVTLSEAGPDVEVELTLE